MKAIGHTEYGSPDVLRELELPEPIPATGEVLVRIQAAAVSPTDTLRVSGLRKREMADQEKPYVPGMDFAGEVLELGPDTVSDLRPGDRVMGFLFPTGPRGAYSEQLALPVESVVRIPCNTDVVAASTIPMNAMTAQMTLDLLDLKPAQTLAITGAAGTFGGYVVQLAKEAGLHVIADAAPKDRELVRGFGADHVVDRGEDVAQRIREIMARGVDAVADGAILDDLMLPAIKDEGKIATLRHYEGQGERGITYHPVRVRYYVKEHAKLDRLRQLVEKGLLTPRVADTYPAAKAAEAHRRLAEGGTRGRLVLVFD